MEDVAGQDALHVLHRDVDVDDLDRRAERADRLAGGLAIRIAPDAGAQMDGDLRLDPDPGAAGKRMAVARLSRRPEVRKPTTGAEIPSARCTAPTLMPIFQPIGRSPPAIRALRLSSWACMPRAMRASVSMSIARPRRGESAY